MYSCVAGVATLMYYPGTGYYRFLRRVCVYTRVVRAAHLGYTCGTHVLLILLITETEKTKHNKLILINPPLSTMTCNM